MVGLSLRTVSGDRGALGSSFSAGLLASSGDASVGTHGLHGTVLVLALLGPVGGEVEAALHHEAGVVVVVRACLGSADVSVAVVRISGDDRGISEVANVAFRLTGPVVITVVASADSAASDKVGVTASLSGIVRLCIANKVDTAAGGIVGSDRGGGALVAFRGDRDISAGKRQMDHSSLDLTVVSGVGHVFHGSLAHVVGGTASGRRGDVGGEVGYGRTGGEVIAYGTDVARARGDEGGIDSVWGGGVTVVGVASISARDFSGRSSDHRALRRINNKRRNGVEFTGVELRSISGWCATAFNDFPNRFTGVVDPECGNGGTDVSCTGALGGGGGSLGAGVAGVDVRAALNAESVGCWGSGDDRCGSGRDTVRVTVQGSGTGTHTGANASDGSVADTGSSQSTSNTGTIGGTVDVVTGGVDVGGTLKSSADEYGSLVRGARKSTVTGPVVADTGLSAEPVAALTSATVGQGRHIHSGTVASTIGINWRASLGTGDLSQVVLAQVGQGEIYSRRRQSLDFRVASAGFQVSSLGTEVYASLSIRSSVSRDTTTCHRLDDAILGVVLDKARSGTGGSTGRAESFGNVVKSHRGEVTVAVVTGAVDTGQRLSVGTSNTLQSLGIELAEQGH